jgi:hypothetical protein
MLFVLSLAALGPWCLAICTVVLLGWHATSHLAYAETEYSAGVFGAGLRRQVLLTAFTVFDRLLAGQIMLAWGLARALILLREFVTGLTGISPSVQSEVSGPLQEALAAGRARSWMSLAMQTVSTATRVQTRLAGHVARELGHQVKQQQQQQQHQAPSTPRTPLSSLIALSPQLAQRPARGRPAANVSALPEPPPAGAAPWDDEEQEECKARGASQNPERSDLQRLDTRDMASDAISEIEAFIGTQETAVQRRVVAGGVGGQ